MPLEPHPDPLTTLAWLVESGADEAVQDTPVNRFAAPSPNPKAPPNSNSPLEGGLKKPMAFSGRGAPSAPSPSPKFAQPISTLPPAADGNPSSDHIGRAMEVAAACTTLPELKAALESFGGSPLKRTATNTVFADGNPDARIMLIGEAPGRDEDRAGLPFVGRAGQLLDLMLASIGLSRKENAYITNVINWRPPGNRDPSPEEAAINLPFLRRHIELFDPGIIILLGAVSARHVLGKTEGIMRMRGKWSEYFVGGRMVPAMPTLHPAYLLRRPIDKKLAWHDLQAIATKARELEILPS
jgi:DNA polymerase